MSDNGKKTNQARGRFPEKLLTVDAQEFEALPQLPKRKKKPHEKKKLTLGEKYYLLRQRLQTDLLGQWVSVRAYPKGTDAQTLHSFASQKRTEWGKDLYEFAAREVEGELHVFARFRPKISSPEPFQLEAPKAPDGTLFWI